MFVEGKTFVIPFLFLSQSALVYLLTLGVEGYCCTLSQSMTDTHITLGTTPLDE
jgi:hypothetical protein